MTRVATSPDLDHYNWRISGSEGSLMPGEELLNQLRALCLPFPEAVEAGGVGDPSFKVREKIFAMQHQIDGRPSLWCKARPGVQQALVGTDPARYFVPPYVGHH